VSRQVVRQHRVGPIDGAGTGQAQPAEGPVLGRAPRDAPRGPPADIAFEVDAIMSGADLNYILFGDPSYLAHGRAALRRILR